MWRRISHALHTLCYWLFPTGTAALGVYLTYRATIYEGTMSERAYLFGIALILGTWGWTAARSARRRDESETRFENALQDLTKLVRQISQDHMTIRQVLEVHDATAEILQALQPKPPDMPQQRKDNSGTASVTRIDPNGSA